MKPCVKINKRSAMSQISCRYPKKRTDVLCKVAKGHRCTLADVLRTALDEYIDNHDLENEIAKKAK